MIMAASTDEAVARRVQEGDGEAFGVLVDRYEKKMLRYGRKFLADREDIRDLVQEIFTKAYVNIKSFDADRRFSPWVYRIAHNTFINVMRRRKALGMFSFDFDLDAVFPHPVAPETADRDAARRDIRSLLDRAMDKLDAKYREPLVLHYFEEMDYRQIAEIMHLPVSTVGIRLKRGRALLQKAVEGMHPLS